MDEKTIFKHFFVLTKLVEKLHSLHIKKVAARVAPFDGSFFRTTQTTSFLNVLWFEAGPMYPTERGLPYSKHFWKRGLHLQQQKWPTATLVNIVFGLIWRGKE
ncbi:hypothetical protein A8B83_17520 [Rhodobacteraceae bacterium EhC02]|nr:hypothetical protein A8B83_17520 [Rhodobacteraceae bacterium EhC02]